MNPRGVDSPLRTYRLGIIHQPPSESELQTSLGQFTKETLNVRDQIEINYFGSSPGSELISRVSQYRVLTNRLKLRYF